MLGDPRCIGRDRTEAAGGGQTATREVHAKAHRAGGVFVHRPRRPSAFASCLRERLRPTRAPCSVQEGIYGADSARARRRAGEKLLFPRKDVSTFPHSARRPVDSPEVRRRGGTSIAPPPVKKLRT